MGTTATTSVVSVNVGTPRMVVTQNGRMVRTGIYKEPVQGLIKVRRLGLEGDGQADPTVHGGSYKAVYAYPVEHYDYWKKKLPDVSFRYGIFGENLTTRGLLEDTVHIGDSFRIGSSMLTATQPRFPCYKLALRFGRSDIIKRFLEAGRPGFYFSVEQEGELQTGDEIEIVRRTQSNETVSAIFQSVLASR